MKFPVKTINQLYTMSNVTTPSKKKKTATVFVAKVLLNANESERLKEMLAESNRTIDKFVETLLKTIVNDNDSCYLFDLERSLGVKYKFKNDRKKAAAKELDKKFLIA